MAFFTNTHAFYYLIGPSAFFYVRGTLRDNARFSKLDLLHFLPFVLFFLGYVPYLFSSWQYKLLVAENIQSENWNVARFHLNLIISHKADQALTVFHIYFYTASLWFFIWKHKRKASSRIFNVPHYKLIRNWLFIFTLIITIITINYTVVMGMLWVFDDKSIFLQKASFALLFASIVYVGMNMIVMFFPHILYGLPINIPAITTNEVVAPIIHNDPAIAHQNEGGLPLAPFADKKMAPILFSLDYIEKIETALDEIVAMEYYLAPDFKLSVIATKSGLPPHHLTYYYNTVLNITFSEWRNKLKIEYAVKLLDEGHSSNLTIEAISLKAGFAAQNTFIRSFKLYTGQTPSEYIKSIA